MEILKACFHGSYNFVRTVQSENIVMTGTIVFELLEGGKYQYNEVGTYALHETTQNCFQTRFFIIEDTSFFIQKNDKSVLHEFQIPQDFRLPLTLRHVHHCKNDKYELFMTFLSKNKFKTIYKILGPQKNQEIHTVYSRHYE